MLPGVANSQKGESQKGVGASNPAAPRGKKHSIPSLLHDGVVTVGARGVQAGAFVSWACFSSHTEFVHFFHEFVRNLSRQNALLHSFFRNPPRFSQDPWH